MTTPSSSPFVTANKKTPCTAVIPKEQRHCHPERQRGISWLINSIGEIPPFWVYRVDERFLLFSSPSLQFFFSGDGLIYVGGHFDVDELGAVILAGESWNKMLLVFPDATGKVTGHTDVENIVVMVGHDVDTALHFHKDD